MEIEYEGDPAFLDGGIEKLLVTMGELAARTPQEIEPKDALPSIIVAGEKTPAVSDGFNFSTNTIAAHIDAKNGPELVVCALAQLELMQGKASSSRAEILAEMKSATTYYNANMGKNIGQSLSNLTKSKRINQGASDSYSLSASEKKKVEGKVAEIG